MITSIFLLYEKRFACETITINEYEGLDVNLRMRKERVSDRTVFDVLLPLI